MKAKIKSNHQFDVQLNMAKCRNPSSSHQPLLQRSMSTGSLPFHSVALFSCPYVLIELKSITICVLLGLNCLPKHQKNIKAAFAYRFTQTLQKKPKKILKLPKKKALQAVNVPAWRISHFAIKILCPWLQNASAKERNAGGFCSLLLLPER